MNQDKLILLLTGLQETIQGKFERQFTSLELEIRKRDEIIHQLQARILELEKDSCQEDDDESGGGDSTTHDASMEEDFVDDNEDHPFMRDGSVDTVLGTSSTHPRRRFSSPSSDSTAAGPHHNRRSWEEHSEEETLELQDLPRSITPQSLWKDDVAIELESSDDSSEEEFAAASGSGAAARGAVSMGRASSGDEDDDSLLDENGHNNWEVAMLAQELEKRRRSSECSSPGS